MSESLEIMHLQPEGPTQEPVPELSKREQIDNVYSEVTKQIVEANGSSSSGDEGQVEASPVTIFEDDLKTYDQARLEVNRTLKKLRKGEDDIPDSIRIPRDWADSLSEHQEKQQAYLEELSGVLTARVSDRKDETQRNTERQQEEQESAEYREKIDSHNKEIEDREKAKAERVEAEKRIRAEINEERRQAAAARAEAKKQRNELASQEREKLRLLHGEGYLKLFSGEIDEKVRAKVEEQLGPEPKAIRIDMDRETSRRLNEQLGPEPIEPNTVNTEKLKEESAQARVRKAEEQQKTVDAIREFRREFNYNSEEQEAPEDIENYWDFSNPEKIDADAAKNWLHDLRYAGVPDEIIADFPEEFFYKDGEPNQIDEEPESFAKWLAEHPDVKFGPVDLRANEEETLDQDSIKDLVGGILGGSSEPPVVAETVQTPPVVEQPPVSPPRRGRFMAWAKEVWNREGAVTFNKTANGKRIGEATVDTREREGFIDAKAAVAILAAGLAISYSGVELIQHSMGNRSQSSVENNRGGIDVTTGVPDELDISKLPKSEKPGASADKKDTLSINIESGHGFTQEIQDLFPGHKPEEYLDAHKKALEEFGPDYIKGIVTYTTPSGELGIANPGKASMPLEVYKFLSKQLG